MTSCTLATVATAAVLSIAYAFNCTDEGGFCELGANDAQFIVRNAFTNDSFDVLAQETAESGLPSALSAATALQLTGAVALTAAGLALNMATTIAYTLVATVLVVSAVLATYVAVLVLPQVVTSPRVRLAVCGATADLAGFYG